MDVSNLFVRAAERDPAAVRSLLSIGGRRRVPMLVLLAAVGGGIMPGLRTSQAREAPSTSSSAAPRHRELGRIQWQRDFDAGLATSRTSGKPVLVLFDEVPGCHTCVSYGETVLSHPLIVDAAHELFIPVAVFNNVGGADKQVLDSFGEPAWNNPVVRIIDADRRMLAPRVNGDYTATGITVALTTALRASGKPVPAYLELLEAESRAASDAAEAVFAMHCFWEGEAKLGALDGVLATRTGFLDGQEVVEVKYDPARIDFDALVNKAHEFECASSVYCRTDAQREAAARLVGSRSKLTREAIRPSTKDDAYQMRSTVYASVPMLASQAARVNAAVGFGQDPTKFLSPSQVALRDKIAKVPADRRPNLIGKHDLAAAWAEAEAALR